MFDANARGQQIKYLTVADEFNCECLAINVAGAIRCNRVIEVLSNFVSVRGTPFILLSDNDQEIVTGPFCDESQTAEPAPPTTARASQNCFDASLNGKFRANCLRIEWFRSREEARVLIKIWRHQYNAV